LADRIALHEARLAFERENVDLEAKTTASAGGKGVSDCLGWSSWLW
jgi:hypothetical protein